jgi:PTS system fructose-specific IIC component
MPLLPQTNALLALALVLIAGVAGGTLARRLHLPSITGQILAGITLGPSALRLLDPGVVQGMRPITHFALGLIAVTVGNHLNLRRLRNAGKRLAWLVVLETTIVPALVVASVLLVPGTPLPLAMVLGAISVATAPATIVALVSETHSRGVFVKTLVAGVALNNIACIAVFEVARVAGRTMLGGGVSSLALLGAPLRLLGEAMGLGAVIGIALIAATWRVVRPDHLATASVLAILVASGLADSLGLPSLLCCLSLGIVLANVTPDREEVGHRVFSNFESAILTIFFTLAGMELDFSYAAAAGALAAVVFAARVAGKLAAANLAMRLAGATSGVRRYLGMALVPQAGLAIGLIVVLQDDPTFAAVKGLFLAVGITVVAANEIVGPVLTRTALLRSGDFGKDRARLIDFLREDNIVTDLRAASLEDAIARLADVLVDSNRLKVDRTLLLDSILAREREISTCIGEGLAIPHGEIESIDGICGAMGISREGLPFATPDGMPIHCVIVLATPPSERDRHLEVLAAFARTIGGDREVQQRLYTAKTAAHAYELLHAEEAEDFNYYLEREE